MSHSGKPLNLEDIAEKAGVSRSTVSRVINNQGYVSERTRSRVMQVIEAENFRPNPAARALVTRSTRVIGVVIPQTLHVVFEDPYYFPALLQGVSEATHRQDYATLLWWGVDDDEEKFYQRVLMNRMMDGLVIASASANDKLVDRLVELDMPFVMVERPSRFQDRISYVSLDNLQAAQMAVEHLHRLGRQRIGTITGALNNADGYDRMLGYRRAIKLAGLPADETLIAEGDFSRKSGYRGMKQLLAAGVDAVFVGSDMMASGAMTALAEAGARIPQDIALVGFDDLPTAVEAKPSLTTVRQPIQQKGVWATDLLIEQIESGDRTPRQVLLSTQLVVRESCGALLS